ncbi:MAG: ABC transporter substrate-binding protein, partial [Mesorhizobium sp.]
MSILQRNKTRAKMLAAVLLATSAFWAPATFAQDSKPLVIARNIDLNSLDPHRAFCDTCQIYNSSVYESLLTLDKDNKLIPLLASKWEGNADQSSFTFTLDPAAKFSDGSPVEAKDVKWSWERL